MRSIRIKTDLLINKVAEKYRGKTEAEAKLIDQVTAGKKR